MDASICESTTLSMTESPPRRQKMSMMIPQHEKTLLQMKDCWVNNTGLKLEDKVSLAHSKAAFLQGVVMFVGAVHFAQGIWVGVQLTGPSMGLGDCNGVYKGKRYFASVGRNNGVLVPIEKVNKRQEGNDSNVESKEIETDNLREERKASLANLQHIHKLFKKRAAVMHKFLDEIEDKRIKQRFNLKRTVESIFGSENATENDVQVQFSKPGSQLCPADMNLVEQLGQDKQNYILTNPTLPDNPITFASPSFLSMTQLELNECLGRNWRFLFGSYTDINHLWGIREAMRSGSDYTICMVNYRKHGQAFYNQWKLTALRDSNGRVKNYLVVQCEVTDPRLAKQINETLGEAPPTVPGRPHGEVRRRASTGFVPRKVCEDITFVPAPHTEGNQAPRRSSISSLPSLSDEFFEQCANEKQSTDARPKSKKTKNASKSKADKLHPANEVETFEVQAQPQQEENNSPQAPNRRLRKKQIAPFKTSSTSEKSIDSADSFEELSFESIPADHWKNPYACKPSKTAVRSPKHKKRIVSI